MNLSKDAFKHFRRELKRRKVVSACVLYLLACWGGLKAADVALSFLEFDPTVVSAVLLAAAIIGFPFFAVFSWFYEVSSSGITRTPPFVERRFLDNIAILEDRRKDEPMRGGVSRQESAYDWILEIESGPLTGQRFGLEGNIVVGRSTACDLTIPVPRISRQHARFIANGSQLLIEDLGSVNGTVVNGARIEHPTRLNHLDKVEILDVVFRVRESLAHFHASDSTLLYDATLQKN